MKSGRFTVYVSHFHVHHRSNIVHRAGVLAGRGDLSIRYAKRRILAVAVAAQDRTAAVAQAQPQRYD